MIHELEILHDNSGYYFLVSFYCEIIESKTFHNDFDFADFELIIKKVEFSRPNETEYKLAKNVPVNLLEWLRTKCEIYYQDNYFYDEWIEYIDNKNENKLMMYEEY